ncbi:SUMF1/EgtB/PvdO family nonheme iron enzyme [Lewinella sp. W8]|uniref:SUMF1/EgtB/PvdO family nonheme iron enzyme n=1 Tax=Lewinella sp. W8 TaxID=2528208 RepID=UPI0015631473|nr:SUMF1/EgtB/PvdO family nonheme iron enzyme [Lewinella sp. W8]
MASPRFFFCFVFLILAATLAAKDYALFFAVNDYDRMTNLRNPIQNAREIAKELRDKYGFRTEVVENPTLVTIEEKLAEYKAKFASGAFDQKGQLLIFFTGHGTMRGRNGYFMPRDVDPSIVHRTGLEYDYWRDEINGFACQHILVTVDACHSATFDPDFGKNGRDFSRKGDNTKDQILLDHQAYRARLFITSDAQGNETPDNSTLARKFLLALRSHRSQTGYLTHDVLLGTYLKQASPIPGGGEFGGDESASRFLFFRKNTGPSIDLQDQRAWDFARQQKSMAAYQYYLNSFPNGHYRGAARTALDKIPTAPAPTRTGTKIPDFLVFIPGGTFRMGDTVEDEMGEDDEKPVHTVALSDFYLARTEVSVAEFATFVDATRYVTEAERDGGSYKWTGGKWEKQPGTNWRYGPFFKERPESDYNHPVIHVSWNDAVRYCNWLSREHGLQEVYTLVGDEVTPDWGANGYRLPTEAEWEYAARSGGRDHLYAWGTGEPNGNVADESGNWSEGSVIFTGYNDGYHGTSPVGKFPQGNYGLADMTGNVNEWCWDWYASGYYGKSPGSNPRGPSTGTYRVIRGGSWGSSPQGCRTANRFSNGPSNRSNSVGFRLARSSK